MVLLKGSRPRTRAKGGCKIEDLLTIGEQAGGPFEGPGPAVLEATAAVDRAVTAFAGWSGTSAEERFSYLAKVADILEAEQDEVISIAQAETRAAPDWTRFNIEIAANILRQTTALKDAIGETSPRPGYLLRRRPAGVILGFAPWNAAITLAARAVAAPLACGNTVVLKGSELCPKTHGWFAGLFARAGLPKDALTFVATPPAVASEVAEALIFHPGVRRINFTGSTRIGRGIARMAAEALKPCLLALSGKGTTIVLADADLDRAAHAAVFGAFFNAGQICMSSERLVVEERVADDFIAAMGRAMDQRPQAADLIDQAAAERVAALVNDALDDGAELVFGGRRTEHGMEPTLLDRVTPGMEIYREEIFGPVACVIRVEDAEEAVSVANDTDFGLVASVFSQDTTAAADLLRRIEVGIGHVNGSTVYDDPVMPFGGVKASGYGRFGGLEAVHECTEVQWIATHDGSDPREVPELKTD